jgi:hypothetical protein
VTDQCLLKFSIAEPHVHRVRYPPGQHLARPPIHHLVDHRLMHTMLGAHLLGRQFTADCLKSNLCLKIRAVTRPVAPHWIRPFHDEPSLCTCPILGDHLQTAWPIGQRDESPRLRSVHPMHQQAINGLRKRSVRGKMTISLLSGAGGVRVDLTRASIFLCIPHQLSRAHNSSPLTR